MADDGMKKRDDGKRLPDTKKASTNDLIIGGVVMGLGMLYTVLVLTKGSDSAIVRKLKDGGGDILGKIILGE